MWKFCEYFDLTLVDSLTLFRIGLFGAAHGWGVLGGGQKSPPLKSATHILQWRNLVKLYLIPDISNFSPEITKICYIKKYRYRLHFGTWFKILLTFFESLKIVLIKTVAILKMSAKMATLSLPKIKVLWNEGYEVIISVYDVTNKILFSESNYIVDVIMWSKFGYSSISMREVNCPPPPHTE